jgi:putative nucleotidyltransferase with HDIG domain
MQEKVKKALTDFIAAIRAAKIYTTNHPKFTDSVNNLYIDLQSIFKERRELIIGVVNGELAFEQFIFFDLSKKLKPLILYLQEKDIERIVFYQSLQREELARFLEVLADPQGNGKKGLGSYFSLLGIKNIQAGKIKTPSPELKDKVKKLRNYLMEYEGSLEKVNEYLQKVIDQEELDYLELRYDILNFLENMIEMYQEFLDLTTFRRKDLITFVHVLNVTILALHISSKMGYMKDVVLDIGIAALFHDIGKLYISNKIIQKTDKLDKQELSLMKHHSVIGAEILFKYMDSLGILPVVVAFEHHLRYDLKGYPKLAFPQKPHPLSLLVSMCDVYDALSQIRSYKKSYPPIQIYNVMQKERGKSFAPELLDTFFQIIGVWPVKSIVSLSEGSIAAVKEQNRNDIFNPKVEILSPEKKRGLVDLSKKKIKIVEYLDPFGKGKKFLQMIGAGKQASVA